MTNLPAPGPVGLETISAVAPGELILWNQQATPRHARSWSPEQALAEALLL